MNPLLLTSVRWVLKSLPFLPAGVTGGISTLLELAGPTVGTDEPGSGSVHLLTCPWLSPDSEPPLELTFSPSVTQRLGWGLNEGKALGGPYPELEHKQLNFTDELNALWVDRT